MNEVGNKRQLIKQAVGLGTVSIFSYLASYFLRNLLSVATPNMLSEGVFSVEFIGLLSSAYMLVYAIGQLFNGVIGDRVNPKYMICIGLSLVGIVTIAFPLVPFAWVQVMCFVLMGVSLSMLRGPIMKMVSENLPQNYSRTVCTFLSVASFSGPLIASTLAIIFKWKMMFIVSGAISIAIAMIAFVTLGIFERKKIFVFKKQKGANLRGYLGLFKLENFVFYFIAGGVVEIAGTAIGFWIPTYLNEALMFDEVVTSVLYSAMSVITALAPFIALFLFKLSHERDIAIMRGGFLLAVITFVLMLVFPSRWLKVLFLLIARLALACCSGVLWSVYIPGMGSTGKVSGINGFINCMGYLCAAAANSVFAKLLGLSWSGVIGVWCGIAAIGLVTSLVLARAKKEENLC